MGVKHVHFFYSLSSLSSNLYHMSLSTGKHVDSFWKFFLFLILRGLPMCAFDWGGEGRGMEEGGWNKCFCSYSFLQKWVLHLGRFRWLSVTHMLHIDLARSTQGRACASLSNPLSLNNTPPRIIPSVSFKCRTLSRKIDHLFPALRLTVYGGNKQV